MSLNDLHNLTSAEKLHLIEQLWDGLDESDISSPEWHNELLKNRKKLYNEGRVKLISLDELKRQQ